jgi:Domain of unknown function (DUF4126)
MDTLELIGSTMGLGFLAGIRLYATVFALGLAIRFGWFHPGPSGAGLLILAHPAVLTASGLACLLEFFADKVPWVDSFWDSFHTFIRPIGAILLAAASFGNFDPAVKVTLMILCGVVALASTGSKASTRLAINHSPEPFSNIGISLIEDAIIPFGMWISLKHPEIAMAFVSIFLGVFLWLAPKIFRSVRLRWVALWVWLGGSNTSSQGGMQAGRDNGQSARSIPSGRHEALRVVAAQAAPIPAGYARRAQQTLGLTEPPRGIRAAATKTIDGMGNSIGYLAIGEDKLTFVAKRWFRKRVHSIKFAEADSIEWKRGLLMHRLVVRTPQGERAFHVFKDVQIPESSATAPSNQPLAHDAVLR